VLAHKVVACVFAGVDTTYMVLAHRVMGFRASVFASVWEFVIVRVFHHSASHNDSAKNFVEHLDIGKLRLILALVHVVDEEADDCWVIFGKIDLAGVTVLYESVSDDYA
jgi:hypothetical protein